MDNNECLISICIPTNGRAFVLSKTLECILNSNVDKSLFEVCIADNALTNETTELMNRYLKEYSNIVYKKNNSEGWLNSIEALKLGKGRLLRLLNDYSSFRPGEFDAFVKNSVKHIQDDCVLFFSHGALKGGETLAIYSSFDEFMYSIGHYASYSTSFAIMRKDFHRIMMKSDLQINPLFPHTSLLLSLDDKEKYIVDNTKYIENLAVKKGGHDIIEHFVDVYLGLIKEKYEKGKIKYPTYRKNRLAVAGFVAYWQILQKEQPDTYKFTFNNNREIRIKCGLEGWIYYLYRKFQYGFRFCIKTVLINIGARKSYSER